jgi:hypothetical protein
VTEYAQLEARLDALALVETQLHHPDDEGAEGDYATLVASMDRERLQRVIATLTNMLSTELLAMDRMCRAFAWQTPRPSVHGYPEMVLHDYRAHVLACMAEGDGSEATR